MCAANAVVEMDPAGGRKFAKHKSTGRIDGMVAMAMALNNSEAPEDEKPKQQPMPIFISWWIVILSYFLFNIK